MDIVDFIEKVKACPMLWDMKNTQYRDVGKKHVEWEQLAAVCGMESGAEAKLLWKRLRDSFREARRRRRALLTGGSRIQPWKYERQMEFTLADKELPSEVDAELDADGSQDERCNTLRSFEMKDREMKRRLRFDEDFEPDSKRFNLESDPLFDVFQICFKKTVELPKALQLRVQREVFNVVTKAEEEALGAQAFEFKTSPRSVDDERLE